MIEKSKPQTDYPYTYPIPYNLKCDDIDGCAVGTKNRINKFQAPYDLNLNVKDIPGCRVGSLKKGIITERNLNPLQPKYKYIGEKELGKYFENDPYANNSKSTNIKLEKESNNEENVENERNVKSTNVKNFNQKNTKDYKKEKVNTDGPKDDLNNYKSSDFYNDNDQ